MQARSGVYPLLCVFLSGLLAQRPPAGIRVEVVEGEGAINSIAERRARDPIVKVADNAGNPIAGAMVTFVTPDLGASASFPSGNIHTATTGADGLATGLGLRPNNIAGEFQIRVTASYRGQSATAAITQTNAAPAAVKSNRGLAIALLAIIGGGGAGAALVFSRRNTSGGTSNPPSTPSTPATTVVPGAGSFGPP
jgi:hypothetical protein